MFFSRNSNTRNVIEQRKLPMREQNPAAFRAVPRRHEAVVSESISVGPRLERRVNTAERKSRAE